MSDPDYELFAAVMGGGDVFSVSSALVRRPRPNLLAIDSDDGWTPLHYACWEGHLAAVQVLACFMLHFANLEATDYEGKTALHLAATQGHLAVVRELVFRGANLEPADTLDGYTPLHYACLSGRALDVVQELVARAGADMFVTARNGKTAFDVADGNAKDYLLRAYADKVSAREGPQAIHAILQAATFLAARRRQALSHRVKLPLGKLTLDQFQALLLLLPPDSFCIRDNSGALPLHIACRVGAPIQIIRLFVQAYAAALQTADNNGALPLHAACQADSPSLDAIRFVVEQDPNAVQAANNDGALPVHLLCGSSPSVQVVKYLVQLFEGGLAMMTNAGDLPLMVACNTAASQSVLQVLLTAYPEALVYMQEYYSRR